jgi:hypothetical protein
MADNTLTENAQHTQLLKLTDDGKNNNYRAWKSKSFHIMHVWDL